MAGEASGDRHAADVIAKLKHRMPNLHCFGMGGASLKAQGVEIVFSAEEISVMGIVEVLPKVPRILKVLSSLEKEARLRKPVAALLVDVPDFNLRLAKRLKALNIPVIWYISPMVWAWRRGRIQTLAQRVDRMLCILPFEEEVYRDTGVRAKYVGNPLVEQLPTAPKDRLSYRKALNLPEQGRLLAMLPGSRPSEVSRILPTLVKAARLIQTPVVVPVAPGLKREDIAQAFEGLDAHFVNGQAAEVLGACDVAVVASGTATLETALMGCPMVVVYRVAPVSYWVGRALIRLNHFSLVNLLLERALVPELLQSTFTPEAVAQHVNSLWSGARADEQRAGFVEIRQKLGEQKASESAATAILDLIPHQT